MNDYNEFYVKSLESGAQPDSFGNITHTPASMATMMAMSSPTKQNDDFFLRNEHRVRQSNWSVFDWLFNDK